MATSTNLKSAADDLAGMLTRAADRLAADAHLFESPGDYATGVQDVVAMLRAQLSGDVTVGNDERLRVA